MIGNVQYSRSGRQRSYQTRERIRRSQSQPRLDTPDTGVQGRRTSHDLYGKLSYQKSQSVHNLASNWSEHEYTSPTQEAGQATGPGSHQADSSNCGNQGFPQRCNKSDYYQSQQKCQSPEGSDNLRGKASARYVPSRPEDPGDAWWSRSSFQKSQSMHNLSGDWSSHDTAQETGEPTNDSKCSDESDGLHSARSSRQFHRRRDKINRSQSQPRAGEETHGQEERRRDPPEGQSYFEKYYNVHRKQRKPSPEGSTHKESARHSYHSKIPNKDEKMLKQISSEVTHALEEAWTLSEGEKKKVIKALLFKWHPDKNIHQEMLATKVTQHIQAETERLETSRNGQSTVFSFSPGNPFAGSPTYQKYYEEAYKKYFEQMI